MMVQIKQQLVPAGRKKVSRGTNTRKKVCIHDTANTSRGAGAQAHANLQNNNPRQASWQWQVDDKIAIQSYLHTDICWHSGTTKGNTESIAIEICINSDSNYRKAVQNAAELTAKILKDEGLSVSDITNHNAYSGKECPRQLRNRRDGISWNDFINMVRKALGGSTPTPPSSGGSGSSGSSGNKLAEDGRCGVLTISELQRKLRVTVDGRAGEQTWTALQRYLSAPFVDGKISRQSYRASELGNGIVPRAWEFTGRGSSGSQTVQRLQSKVGASSDGIWFEGTTRALQRALNRGTF